VTTSFRVAPVVLREPGALVRLEPLRPRHAPDLLEAGRDDAIWTYLMTRPRTLEDYRAWIDEAVRAEASGRELPFAVVLEADGRAIGSTRYEDLSPAHRALEVGWTWYGAPWQRTEANTRCKHLILRHAFEALGAVRVQLKADARNARSLAAIERIGATREGVLRRHRILPDGFVRDSVVFSVVAEEWPRVKAGLEARLPARAGA
jgi:RimJ/RimL family protein N-acetyltransferase